MGRGRFNWDKVAWDKKIRERGTEAAFEPRPPSAPRKASKLPRDQAEEATARSKASPGVQRHEAEELAAIRRLLEIWGTADVNNSQRAVLTGRAKVLEKRLKPPPPPKISAQKPAKSLRKKTKSERRRIKSEKTSPQEHRLPNASLNKLEREALDWKKSREGFEKSGDSDVFQASSGAVSETREPDAQVVHEKAARASAIAKKQAEKMAGIRVEHKRRPRKIKAG